MDEYTSNGVQQILSQESVVSNINYSIDKSNKYYLATKAMDCCYIQIDNIKAKLSHFTPNTPRPNINTIIGNDSKNIEQAIAIQHSNAHVRQVNFKEIFAVVPITNYFNLFQMNRNFVYLNDVLNMNKRIYGGMTHLKNFRIKLYDDDHDIVNLNGLDWSFTVKLHINSSRGVTPY